MFSFSRWNKPRYVDRCKIVKPIPFLSDRIFRSSLKGGL